MEHEWINFPKGHINEQNEKRKIMPIQLLVSKEMKTFTEYKIVDYEREFPPTACIMGQDLDSNFTEKSMLVGILFLK